MTNIVLVVNGTEYAGWTAARVTRSIETICGGFELSLTERWSDTTARRKISPGDACAVLLDDTTVITGYVDDVSPSYTAAAREVVVSGRDLTADLVDCSAPTGQTLGQTFLALARLLCAPHGVAVRVATGLDLSKPFRIEAGQESESAHERLERLARYRGVLLVSDGKGAIEITRAGKQRLATPLVLGKNILRGDGRFSQRDLYRSYLVKAQQQEVDFPGSTGGGTPSSQALVLDKSIRSNRRLTVLAEETADIESCRDRARWERNVRAGRGTRLQYTVQGWTHDGKDLWPLNRLVRVVDEWFDLNAELLLVATEFSLGADGSFTELTLCDPRAFSLLELAEEEAVF